MTCEDSECSVAGVYCNRCRELIEKGKKARDAEIMKELENENTMS